MLFYYRQYCSRKLKRVRKVINFPQGNKYKVYREMIPEELVTEPRLNIQSFQFLK